MNINNYARALKYKRIFYIGGVVFALIILGLFLLNKVAWALIALGGFSLWYLYFHVADYRFIEFLEEDNRIILRFYKAIGFGPVRYQSIEFPKELLRKADFENSIFGKYSDLTLLIRTERGMAEYPAVSLSALSQKERFRLKRYFDQLLGE